jgi:hypothetical protein
LGVYVIDSAASFRNPKNHRDDEYNSELDVESEIKERLSKGAYDIEQRSSKLFKIAKEVSDSKTIDVEAGAVHQSSDGDAKATKNQDDKTEVEGRSPPINLMNSRNKNESWKGSKVSGGREDEVLWKYSSSSDVISKANTPSLDEVPPFSPWSNGSDISSTRTSKETPSSFHPTKTPIVRISTFPSEKEKGIVGGILNVGSKF